LEENRDEREKKYGVSEETAVQRALVHGQASSDPIDGNPDEHNQPARRGRVIRFSETVNTFLGDGYASISATTGAGFAPGSAR